MHSQEAVSLLPLCILAQLAVTDLQLGASLYTAAAMLCLLSCTCSIATDKSYYDTKILQAA